MNQTAASPKSPALADFAWLNGYGILSIGFSQIESVRENIAGQEEHHRKVSFQDEFRQLLRSYEIEFDAAYRQLVSHRRRGTK